MKNIFLILTLLLGSLITNAICPNTTDVNSGVPSFGLDSLPNGGNIDSMSIDTFAGATLNSFGFPVTISGTTLTGTVISGISDSTVYQCIYYYYNGSVVDSCKSVGYLPATLLNFIATRQGDQVKLVWVTASENNCESFTLERIGKNPFNIVTEGTNTNQIVYYEFIDDYTDKATYKLSQKDFDGKNKVIATAKVEGVEKRRLIGRSVIETQNCTFINYQYSDGYLRTGVIK